MRDETVHLISGSMPLIIFQVPKKPPQKIAAIQLIIAGN